MASSLSARGHLAFPGHSLGKLPLHHGNSLCSFKVPHVWTAWEVPPGTRDTHESVASGSVRQRWSSVLPSGQTVL